MTNYSEIRFVCPVCQRRCTNYYPPNLHDEFEHDVSELWANELICANCLSSSENVPLDEPAHDNTCPYCHGIGTYMGDTEPCEHCDGEGREWWRP